MPVIVRDTLQVLQQALINRIGEIGPVTPSKHSNLESQLGLEIGEVPLLPRPSSASGFCLHVSSRETGEGRGGYT